MSIFGKRKKGETSPKKVRHIEREFPSRGEIVAFMRDEELPAQTVEAAYTPDGEMRYVIFRTAGGFFTYRFERLLVFGEEEYRHSAAPAVWQPFPEQATVGVYASVRDLKKQIVFEPEYRTYFAEGQGA